MNRFLGGSLLVGAGCLVAVAACAPTSSEVGRMRDPDAGVADDGGEMPDGPTPNGNMGGTGGGGNAACQQGQAKPAGDGCNTCTCDASGQWNCTEIGCICKTGETRIGDDGCSKCSCDNGNWACDPQGCAECSPGSVRASDDMCSMCTCGTDGTWQCPPAGTGCGTPCEEGASKPAGDGCNDCTCFHGNWGCTMVLCAAPIPCEDGVGDCDGNPMNGCETKLTTDLMNCGACGQVCDFAGGIGSCEGGKCVLQACTSGWADCNLDPSDGCEQVVGNQGCDARCDYPDGSPMIVPATGDCQCPTGMTCVKNTALGKPDYCYPTPNACGGGHAPDCLCLGTCVCSSNGGRTCSEQMTTGGFVLDCDGLK